MHSFIISSNEVKWSMEWERKKKKKTEHKPARKIFQRHCHQWKWKEQWTKTGKWKEEKKIFVFLQKKKEYETLLAMMISADCFCFWIFCWFCFYGLLRRFVVRIGFNITQMNYKYQQHFYFIIYFPSAE